MKVEIQGQFGAVQSCSGKGFSLIPSPWGVHVSTRAPCWLQGHTKQRPEAAHLFLGSADTLAEMPDATLLPTSNSLCFKLS